MSAPALRRALRSLRLAAATLLVLVPSVRAAEQNLTISTADGPRRAVVVAAPTPRAPAVIVLHGALGTPAQVLRTTGFREAATERGFSLVAPAGIGRKWNDGRDGKRDHAFDDAGFIKALVARLVADGLAPRDRIFIAGISNGGMMTFRLLCDAPELFAGAGTIIASMPGGIGERCKPAVAVPLVMLNGTADPMVPYAGGRVGLAGGRGIVWGAEPTAAFFARSNQCAEPADREVASATGSSASLRIVERSWHGCRAGADVTLFRIEGGGHQVPGKSAFLPAVLGRTTTDISAADAILARFAAVASRRSTDATPR